MKILFSTYEIPGLSGNFIRTLNIAKGLKENGCELTILCSGSKVQIFPKRYSLEGIDLIEQPGFTTRKVRHAGFDPLDFLSRLFFSFATKFDGYHAFNPKPVTVLPFHFMGKLIKRAWFLDWADLWGEGGISEFKMRGGLFSKISSKVETFLEKFAIRNASLVTCISHEMMNECKKLNQNSFYLPVGSASDLSPIRKKNARKNLNLKKADKIIGFIFTHSPDDDYLKKLIKQLSETNIKILLMGPPIFQLLPRNVYLNKFVERKQLSLYISACDIMILPFTNKKVNRFRYPNKIGDYIATDRPFITHNTGDVRSLIQMNRIGWIAEDDVESFAAKIRSVLDHPVEIEDKKKNIRSVKKNLTWKRLTKNLKWFYVSSSVASV